MIDAFEEVRQRISALDAARFYGLDIDRHNRTLCLFHTDHHPSMTFKHGRYRCWTCGARGSSIDLAAKLLNLTPWEAVRRLNNDFRLGLPLDRPPTKEEQRVIQHRAQMSEAHAYFENWRSGFIDQLNRAYRRGQQLQVTDLNKLTDAEATALRMNATFEYWSDVLSYGTPADQAQIYRERRAIGQWMDRALKN